MMRKQPLILIVDDDEVLLESIADLLLLSEFQVMTASNGVEALDALQERVPDCIVSDVMMPQMDGYALLEALRQNDSWATIPVILITAYDRPFSDEKKRGQSPDAMLAKPFNLDQLVTAINQVLGV
jgi:CheY-like chemotaxis protein